MISRGGRSLDWGVCTAGSLLFCFLTFQDIRLPGPNNDEVFVAAPAVNFHENRYETDAPQINPSIIELFGRPFPLMVMTYVGSVQTFLYLPAFGFFGDGIEVIRGLPILVAVISIWFSYYFFLLIFGRFVALLAVVLLLADPGFIFFVGRDFGPPAVALFCKMAGLYLLVRWWRENRTWTLIAAALLWGIGLYHKADFLWILAAATVAGVVAYRGELRARLRWGTVAAAGSCFIAGSAPFFVMNLLTGGATFSAFSGEAKLIDQLFSFAGGIGTRAQQMVDLMNGTASFRLFMGDTPALNIVQMVALPLAVFAGFILFARWSTFVNWRTARRSGIFLALMTLLVFIQTAKSPTALMEHHMMAVYPLLHGAAAAGWFMLLQHTPHGWRGTVRGAIILLAVMCLVTGVTTTQGTYAALRETGGRGYWSDAIYELNDYLLAEQRPVAAMEWGFTANLIVTSKGALRIDRVYRAFLDRGYSADVVRPFVNERRLYIFHTPEFESFAPALRALTEAGKTEGVRPREIRTFYQRDRKAVYTVYSMEPVQESP